MVFKGYIPFMGFPRGSVGEESTSNVGDPGWILGGEDPLEKEMAAHSSILAWRIPRTEEPGGPQFMGSQRIGQDQASKHTQFIVIMSYWLYCLCESESHSTVHEILQARTRVGCHFLLQGIIPTHPRYCQEFVLALPHPHGAFY